MDTTEFNKTTTIIGKDNIFNNEELVLQNVSDKKSIRNLFLDEKMIFLDIEDAEVFYSSKMNNNTSDNLADKEAETKNIVQPFLMPSGGLEKGAIFNNTNDLATQPSPFILANTIDASLHHLRNECIIPVFSKDNEKTIAHQEFIDLAYNAVQKVFPMQTISAPEIRVSHQIKGRTPDAIHLNVKDLLEHQKTIYYERMAFIIRIPNITEVINGNELSLCIGGVRSYNLENLYNKKSFEKFKFFIGFQNKVCCNLCVSTDGFLAELKVPSTQDLYSKILEAIQNYDTEQHLMEMKKLT